MNTTRALLLFSSVIAASLIADAQSIIAPASGGAPKVIAEKVVTTLPSGPLYWSVRSFKTLEQAQQNLGEFSLAAESDGRPWLFTLGPKAKKGKAAEAGPITPPKASRFLLRISESITPPGRVTPVHSHPGSEAFYVLKGELEYKTTVKTYRVSAGTADAGPPPDTTMQATTMGPDPAHNLIMFLLDADKPAQVPANF